MIYVIIFLGIAGIATLFTAYYTYSQCFRADPLRRDHPYAPLRGKEYIPYTENMKSVTRIMDSAPCEDVTISSHDGLKLWGRYYHTNDGAPLQVMFHGYRSLALRDCAGAYILAKKMGFNVLAIDHRSHARSDGRAITFGILERLDCLSWINYAVKRFGADTPIILSGLSMGAATVLMASELELPENVCCIIGDCPYSSPRNIIRKVSKDKGFPEKLVYPFIRIGARLFGGFSLESCSADEAVKNSKIPILLIHGEADGFVPCDMSRSIYEGCKDHAQLHTFPGAGHCLAYMIDPLRYEDVTVRFLWDIPVLRRSMERSEFVQKQLRGEIQY